MFTCQFVIFIVVLFVLTINGRNSGSSENLIVNTKLGRIKGNILTARFDTHFYAFRGIRYGKPPMNELRFKAPEPVEHWDGIYDATTDGPACPQPFKLTQSEDCLRLNVYTKNLPEKTGISIKKPVLFMIPGGGLSRGSGVSTDAGGPKYFMEQDIILVTINYRLGVLGFLGLNTIDAPGNAGFKDQVLALKWVQNNIDKFGGDPNQVMVLGQSAGGYSILLHLVSPMSTNLFNKAIIMSPVGMQNKIKTNHIELSKKVAVNTGCMNCSIPTEIYNFLKLQEADKLINSVSSNINIAHLYYEWNAVTEPDYGQERFLAEDPFLMLKRGNYTKIPLVIGMANTEFAYVSFEIVTNETLFKSFPEQFHVLLPICFRCEKDSDYERNTGTEILNAYNISRSLALNDFPKLVTLYSDGLMGFGIQKMVDFFHDSVDVFYYHLTFHQRYSYFMLNGKPYGIDHGDEMKYLFEVNPLFNQNDPENIIIERMTRFWAQFALTGNPNKEEDQYIGNIIWRAYTDKNKYYLDFGDYLVLKNNLFGDRLRIWFDTKRS